MPRRVNLLVVDLACEKLHIEPLVIEQHLSIVLLRCQQYRAFDTYLYSYSDRVAQIENAMPPARWDVRNLPSVLYTLQRRYFKRR